MPTEPTGRTARRTGLVALLAALLAVPLALGAATYPRPRFPTDVNGAPLSANDLQAAGSAWPNTLDSTGLIPTFGFTAPAAAGSSYLLTLTVNKTTNGRLFIRNSVIFVAAALG